ncbi:MAG TPA: hypothetical protein VMZ30_04000 [Pyrinomonadaceae bacterium]|nr:hypothetical protein [Pyrinomonadaceae bacterium]
MRNFYVVVMIAFIGFVCESLTRIHADLPTIKEPALNCNVSKIDALFHEYELPNVAGQAF